MNGHDLESLTSLLQASIPPVALVSGVGLLILSLSNRLGRVMDRLRELLDRRRSSSPPDPHVDKQVDVLHRRARILRNSITAAALSVLLASLLVLSLFVMAVATIPLELMIIALFASSLVALIVSMILFLVDMNLSLRAVQEELLR